MRKTIIHKNRNLSYQIGGEGLSMIFLHGFCEDSSMWDSFKMPFEQNCRVICPDLPGFGRSEVWDNISIEDMAESVNYVLEAEQIESCIFVGHSMGGYVAMAFAEKYPEKLKGLCLFHSHPFADSTEKKENRRKTIDFMERWGSPAFVKELVPKLFSKEFISENPAFVKEFAEHASGFSKTGIIAATRAMINRPDRSEILKELTCPLLLIIGEKDEAIPFTVSERQIGLNSKAKVHVLDVAHMGMFEAKEKCTSALSEFINGIYF